MSGYYPAGVTGMEDEIAGPRAEREGLREVECPNCEWEGEVCALELVWSRETIQYWKCPNCGTENETEVTE